MTTLSDLNAEPAVRQIVDVAAQAFVERFSLAYEQQRNDGGPEFDADVWYRLALGNSGPVITVTAYVREPVFGLTSFLASIATSVATQFDWVVTIRTSVRLAAEFDAPELEAGGWRHREMPPPVQYPHLSMEPDQPVLQEA